MIRASCSKRLLQVSVCRFNDCESRCSSRRIENSPANGSKAFNEFIVEADGMGAGESRVAIIVPRSPISEIYRAGLGKARSVLNSASLCVATR